MTGRKIELFTAGCPLCRDAEEMVRKLACTSCEVQLVDMHDPAGAGRARELGVCSVPAVAVDGQLAGCCTGRGPEESMLRAAGLGRAID